MQITQHVIYVFLGAHIEASAYLQGLCSYTLNKPTTATSKTLLMIPLVSSI